MFGGLLCEVGLKPATNFQWLIQTLPGLLGEFTGQRKRLFLISVPELMVTATHFPALILGFFKATQSTAASCGIAVVFKIKRGVELRHSGF